MIKYIENRLALSNEGVHDFLKAVFWSILFNLALMLPAVYVYVFLKEYLEKSLLLSGDVSKGFWHFIFLGLLFFLFTWIVARIQYRSTYTRIYRESANRRISLAEKLRCLPLAFFNEKNLSDLTSTIMSDNTELEKIFSHAVPQLFASLGSILLLGTGLFLFNWKLALALFWVVPFAGFIILFSKRTQHRNFKSCYDAKDV
jgi:ATP-binding cassette subfamily B protein